MELTKNNSTDFRVCELVTADDKSKVTTDDIELRIIEVIEGGTWQIYDWNDGTFKVGPVTTQKDDCTHKTVDNGTYDTGDWENDTDISKDAFTLGRTYLFEFLNNTESELISQTRTLWGNYGPIAIETTSQTIEGKVDTVDGIVDTINGNVDTVITDIGNLNDITVADILAGTADGKTIEIILERVNAYVRGKIVKSGSPAKYAYKKEDGLANSFNNETTNSSTRTPR